MTTTPRAASAFRRLLAGAMSAALLSSSLPLGLAAQEAASPTPQVQPTPEASVTASGADQKQPAPEMKEQSKAAPPVDKKAVLKQIVKMLLYMTDADYRKAIAELPPGDARAPQLASRQAALHSVSTTLAALEYDAAAGKAGESGDPKYAKAAQDLREKDAEAVGIDPKTMQESGWAITALKWLGSAALNYWLMGAPLLVGRDAGPLAKAEQASAELSKEGLSATKEAELHYQAGAAYETLAAIKVETPETAESTSKDGVQPPSAAAVKAQNAPAAEPKKEPRSPQEVYRAASSGVVLLIASDSPGTAEMGTGSLVSASGRILTNAHVVINPATGQPFGSVRVYYKPPRLTGDPKRDLAEPRKGRVESYDRALDLALVDAGAPPEGAAVIELGDSDAVEPGQAVVAIGHPEQGGLWTLTQGIVSTVVADLGGVKGKDAFQTDASINRGNSGGPLLDLSGRQIGVNTSMTRKSADGLAITSVNFSVKSAVASKWLSQRKGSASETAAPAAKATVAVVAKVPELPAQPPAAAQEPVKQPKAAAPAIVTPKRPYKIDDLIQQQIGEMEDMGKSMHQAIQDRMRRR